jgi:hypothetical protein
MDRKNALKDPQHQPESPHEAPMKGVTDLQANIPRISAGKEKRIVDYGLLEDDEAAALGNLAVIEALLRNISEDGQSGAEDISLFLQDACWRAADMLCDSYRVLRERMLEFVGKEALGPEGLHPAE